MNSHRKHPPAIAGAKAGFNTATAYRFEKGPPRNQLQQFAHRHSYRANSPARGTALETFKAAIAFENSIA